MLWYPNLLVDFIFNSIKIEMKDWLVFFYIPEGFCQSSSHLGAYWYKDKIIIEFWIYRQAIEYLLSKEVI